MWEDPIVEELHTIREAHAARFGFDLRAIVKDLRREQQEGNRKVVSFVQTEPPAVIAEGDRPPHET